MRTDRRRRMLYAAGAAGWVISAGVMAVTFRVWQLHLREVEQRAEEAERTREDAAQRRAMEERLRIARELHDSLTHTISVICVQAGVAAHLARKRGEDVPPALLAIQEAGVEAARELRTTLQVLRTAEDGDSSGLGQLDSLVARAEAAGLPVTVTVTGTERPLPPEVDRAAYRIVQEALTNVGRHAGLAGGGLAGDRVAGDGLTRDRLAGSGLAGGGQVSAWVHLHYTPEALSVQVDDDGAGTSVSSGNGLRPAGHGLGLIGMRERVTALGGRLHAGPRDGGGFRVRAELPVRAPS
jgi:signal transduction histidine kinase